MSIEIAIVVSPRDWAEQLHRFVADHGGARVRARVLGAREAIEEGYQVLVADDLTSFLTPRLVELLHRDGRRVLGVYDPIEQAGRERLMEFGVDDTIAALATPEEFLAVIDGLALAARSDLDIELRQLVDGTLAGAPTLASEDRPDGTVVAVAGPPGGPGATELAIALAHAVREGGGAPVLVDADDVAPAVAQRLGLALHPNLRTAADIVQHLGGQLSDVLQCAGGLDVLTGMPKPRDHEQLRPGEVVDVIDELAGQYPHVVVNVGHLLEDVTAGSGSGRYRITQGVLAAADRILAVAAATPIGLSRLLDWIADTRTLSEAPIDVVFNRAPGERFARAELETELRRTFSPGVVAFVPDDPRVPKAAWSGEAVAAGPFSRAVEELAGQVIADLPGPATSRRSRWQRRH